MYPAGESLTDFNGIVFILKFDVEDEGYEIDLEEKQNSKYIIKN